MSFWADIYMRQEQAIDRRQEAANHRLIRQIRDAEEHHLSMHAQMMASLGRRLMAWGQRLEAQYDA